MAHIIKSGDGLMDSFMGKSMYPIYAVINDMASQYEEKMCPLQEVFTTIKANGFGMKVVDEVGIGDYAPTDEGSTFKSNYVREGFSTSTDFVEWTNRLEITRKMMEDNNASQIKQKAGLFGVSFHRTQEKFRAAMLGNATGDSFTLAKAVSGTQTFSTKTADGVSLFNTKHPSRLEATAGTPDFLQSNRFTNALDSDTFGEIVTRMQNFTDDKGDKCGITPNTVVIPNDHALKRTLFGIIGSDKDPSSANNEFNYLFGTWRVIISPELSSYLKAGEYIIADTNYNEMAQGAVWGHRLDAENFSDILEDTKNFQLSSRARFTAVFHNWRAFAIGGTATGTTLT